MNFIVYDIETAPQVGLFFGNVWNASIAKTIDRGYVLGFSWKPLGKKVQSCYIWDFKLYKKEPKNDIEVVKKWIEVVAGNVMIGHNSRSFDDKVMMARVVTHRLSQPEPFMTIDTKADLKRVTRNDSNKLDDLGEQYGIGKKKDTGGIDLWWDCMNGNKKAQKKMVDYCEQDVKLTEKLYEHIKPYIKSPPMNVINDNPQACPNCGVVGKMQRRGYKYAATQKYQRYWCKACDTYPTSRVPIQQIVKMEFK